MVGALPLVVWQLELAANGARPGFRAKPGKPPSAFNHHTVYRGTLGTATGSGPERGLFIRPANLITAAAVVETAIIIIIIIIDCVYSFH